MGSRRFAWMIVGGLAAALGTALAGVREGEGVRQPTPPAPARDPGVGPDGRKPGGPGGPPAGQPGDSLPAVREEMQRYRQALRDILAGNLALAREADNAFRQLREKGAEEAELQAAAKALAPQARELAEKHAAALATHYENLAKIFKPIDEAARKRLVDSLAEEILNRMSSASAFPLVPPGRFEGGRPPDVGPARDRGEGPPSRTPGRVEEGGRTVAPREGAERRPQAEERGGRTVAPREGTERRPEKEDPTRRTPPANF